MKIFLSCILLVSGPLLHAQDPIVKDPALGLATIPLYENSSRTNSVGNDTDEPTLTVFLPQHGRGNGSAVVVIPGGAYTVLVSNLEGRQPADWFAARGFTAFVLKYRYGPKNLFPVPLADGQRAIRLVRSLGTKYGFSPDRVGVIGFSAGGHLAASLATLPSVLSHSDDRVDSLSAIPNFVVLAYPWLDSMEPAVGKEITYCSVIPSIPRAQCDQFAKDYTPKLHVSSHVPPTFIFSTTDDQVVPIRASVEFYSALIAQHNQAELHIFEHGDHGAGLGSGNLTLDAWPTLLEHWLNNHGLLQAPR